MDDDIPHELSTITEVDTPATSRLNATDLTVGNESTTANTDAMKRTQEQEVLKFVYKHFPNFKEYAKTNLSLSQLSTTIDNNSVDVTATASLILGEKLHKLLEINESQKDAFKYRAEGDKTKFELSNPSTLNYRKFPTHSQYANSVSGLLDSQSIDQVELSDASDHSNCSSLPDIVNELKNRNILENSFKMISDEEESLEDLLKIGVTKQSKPIAEQSTKNTDTDTALERDLNSMGMSWATVMLKKSREANSTSSSSSDSLSRRSTVHRSSYKSLNKSKQQSINLSQNQTNDSADFDSNAKPINLKEFLARELLKHSSMSSSSDSSLASIFLKSFLGVSTSSTNQSEQNNCAGIADKHRTSTPVNFKSTESSDSKNNTKRDSTLNVNNKKQSKPIQLIAHSTGHDSKLFSDESHLSSVRLSSPGNSSDEQKKHAEFNGQMIPASMKLHLAEANKIQK